MGFSKQEYWGGFPPPGDGTWVSWIAGGSLPAEPPGKPWRSRYGPSIPVYSSLSSLRFCNGLLLLHQWVGIAWNGPAYRVGEVGWWWCMWFLTWGLWVWLQLEAWERDGRIMYLAFHRLRFSSVSSVAHSCPTLCDPMNCSTPGLSVHHKLPEFTQTHVHRVSDAIQPSHPLSSPSPPAPNPSQHQSFPVS